MKSDRIITIITVILAILAVCIYSGPIYNFVKNHTLDYTKEVYLGGDNIVLDYLATHDDNSVTALSEYATIGTMTYIDKNGNFGAVGHELDYAYSGTGNIFIVPVHSVIKSTKEYIGEKNVNIGYWKSDGSISKIGNVGVYGKFVGDLASKKTIMVGMPKEIEISDGLLYTNVDGSEVKAYKIKIEKLFYSRSTHNIYIKVVDPELLKLTGGIIQGMSGSPIVQNDKIIGSLSHVDDNNPEYGYGLFITYMI